MISKSVKELPIEYEQKYSVNLKSNKKIAFLINFSAIIFAVILVVPMLFVVPFDTFIDFNSLSGENIYKDLLKFVILGACIVVYTILHELVHGLFIKIFTKEKAKYGFTGAYAFAGSDYYFIKKEYIVIALSPVVIWGVVLTVLCLVLPTDYFWFVYIIQVVNLTGAVGDIFITAKIAKFPKETLVKDEGVSMVFYTHSNTK